MVKYQRGINKLDDTDKRILYYEEQLEAKKPVLEAATRDRDSL